jgi:hypothetical protein
MWIRKDSRNIRQRPSGSYWRGFRNINKALDNGTISLRKALIPFIGGKIIFSDPGTFLWA